MVRIPVSRNRVSPQVTRDPGLVVDSAAFGGPIEAAGEFGQAALGLARDISEINDPADREKVMKRAAAQRKAVSNKVTADGVRELVSSRDSLEKTAPPGADGFEQMYGGAFPAAALVAAHGPWLEWFADFPPSGARGDLGFRGAQ